MMPGDYRENQMAQLRPLEEMNEPIHTCRYYYYCGPFSTWRDGRAMDGRELST